jgi:hypothetical protein
LVAMYEKEKRGELDKGAVADRARELAEVSKGFRPSLVTYNDSRFGPAHATGFVHRYAYTLDGPIYGQPVWVSASSLEQAREKRLQHIERERERLDSQILVQFYDQVVPKWEEIAKRGRHVIG